MDPEFLARFQFALTICFHYLFPPLSIGLSVVMVIMEGLYLKTHNSLYEQIARFLTKIFALTFAVGVSTGVIMEFQFGMNWSEFSRFTGDISSALLGSETMIAFFLESTFLALLVFGWDKLSPKMHFFSTTMVALGAHLSAMWIIMFNSRMNTPAGHQIVDRGQGPRAEVVDIFQVAFNPSFLQKVSHVVFGCWLTGGFLVISVAAYYLLKKQHIDFAKKMIKVTLIFTGIVLGLQTMSGHASAVGVAQHQPAKLAAFEALYETEPSSGLTLFGIVDEENKKLDYEVTVPGLLSFLVYMDFITPVTGLDQIPPEDRPPVAPVFYSYRIMLQMWGFMVGLVGIALWLVYRDKLWDNKWVLRALVSSFIFPQLANQSGWFSAEVGRQPWLVQGLLRRHQGFSHTVPSHEMLGGIIIFTLIYIVLFSSFVYLIIKKIKHGPDPQPLVQQSDNQI